jgi:hypothetical protein
MKACFAFALATSVAVAREVSSLEMSRQEFVADGTARTFNDHENGGIVMKLQSHTVKQHSGYEYVL